MKKLISLINDAFITIILTIFYIVGVGLTAILHRLIENPIKKNESYWIKPKIDEPVDFSSAY